MLTFLYNVVTTILGFLEHPYPTMQKVVKAQVPFVYIFFPAVLCIVGWFVARTFAAFFLRLVPLLGIWWFLEVWWLVFWGLWQVTLLYLYSRFRSTLQSKK